MSEMSKNFIPVYNRIFKFDNNKLSPLQLYLYCYLFRSRLEFEKLWITYTNISLILSRLQCKVEGKGKEKLETIRSSLITLQDKGYIFSNVHAETSFDSLIKITFPTITDGLVDSKGYYTLYYSVYDKIEDKECLYIFCYLESNYNNDQKRHYKNKLSLTDWSKLLEVSSKTTATSRLDSLNTVNSYPRVWKISGENIDGSTKQQENYYYTQPDEKTILKWNNLYYEDGKSKYPRKHKYSGEDTIISLYWGETTVDEFEEATEIANWGRVNDYFQEGFGEIKFVDLEFDDYSIYRTCKEYNIFPKFIVKCENIMKAKRNYTDLYDGCFEKWEKLYNYEVSEDQEENDEVMDIKEEMRLKQESQRSKYIVKDYNYDDPDPF